MCRALALAALSLSLGCAGGAGARPGRPARSGAEAGPPVESAAVDRGPGTARDLRRPDPLPPAARTVDWVLYVYMAADNDLDLSAVDDFNAMSGALVADPTLPRIAVVVLLDRLQDTWDGYYELKPGMPLADAAGRPQGRVLETGELDTNDSQTLRNFLNWGEEHYKASNQALLIWSHGQGWRGFVDEDLLRLADRLRHWRVSPQRIAALMTELRTHPLDADKFNAVLNRFLSWRLSSPQLREAVGILRILRGRQPSRATLGSFPIHYDESNDRLPGLRGRPTMANHDAADKLRDGEFGLLGFDACSMDMLETAYEFRNKAEVMVASEDLITAWPLAAIVADLQHNLGWSSARFATQIVDDSRGRPLVETLAAIRMSGIIGLAAQVSNLSRQLMTSLDQGETVIAQARADTVEFGKDRNLHLYHVDIRDFLDHLGTRHSAAITAAAIDQVARALSDVVIASYADTQHDGQHGLAHAQGLAIYFPPAGQQFATDPHAHGDYNKPRTSPSPVSFVNDQLWADFINLYAKKNP
jgi:hypothetical protein